MDFRGIREFSVFLPALFHEYHHSSPESNYGCHLNERYFQLFVWHRVSESQIAKTCQYTGQITDKKWKCYSVAENFNRVFFRMCSLGYQWFHFFHIMPWHWVRTKPLWDQKHPLTHWGQDKMAAMFQMAFSYIFYWMKMFEFHWRFHWSLFLRFALTYSSIGSDNGLAPTRRQAIIKIQDSRFNSLLA